MNKPFFFYGTLLDPDVRAAVIGRPVPAEHLRAATLIGYVRRYRANASYPVLVPSEGARVDGLLVSGVRPPEVERLIAFEGDEYALIEIPVSPSHGTPLTAATFLSLPTVPATSEAWAFEPWRRRHKQAYLLRIAGRGGRRRNEAPRHAS